MMATTPTQDSLLQLEAIELAHTVVVKAAEHVRVRVLAIKGLVASAHNLRADRTPADVDILIDPAGFDAVLELLGAWGWHPRIEDGLDAVWQQHSATYIHQKWPCDIDAHHRYPGLLAPPQQVFDVLWARREFLFVAGRRIPVADWASSVAVMAAHSARSSPDIPRHASELQTLVDLSLTWSGQLHADLADLAVEIGCAQSLEDIWKQLGVPLEVADEDVSSDDLAEWRTRQSGRLPGARMWLRYVVAGGPRHGLTRLLVALWPPEGHMRSSRDVPAGRFGLFRARMTRLAQMARKAPSQLLAVVHGGNNVTQNVVHATNAKLLTVQDEPHHDAG